MRGCSCRGTAGFAHVSCLAEQAKILVAEAEENNLATRCSERWNRWATCSSLRAKLPRRRGVRARMGVLENVRGGGRRRTGARDGDDPCLGTVYTRQNTTRTRCP